MWQRYIRHSPGRSCQRQRFNSRPAASECTAGAQLLLGRLDRLDQDQLKWLVTPGYVTEDSDPRDSCFVRFAQEFAVRLSGLLSIGRREVLKGRGARALSASASRSFDSKVAALGLC